MSDSSTPGEHVWPPGITDDDAQALDELAADGLGEGAFGHDVPVEMIDLHIALEEGATHEELRALRDAGWGPEEE